MEWNSVQGRLIRLLASLTPGIIIVVIGGQTLPQTGSLPRIADALLFTCVAVGIGQGIWEASEPDLVLWDDPAPPIAQRIWREFTGRVPKFLGRSIAWGYGAIIAVLVLGMLISLGESVGPPIGQFLFRDAPPALSGAIVAAFALLITTALSIFVGRYLEDRRLARHGLREVQRPTYLKVHKFILENDQIVPEKETEWQSLADEVLMIASARVIDAFGDYSQLAHDHPKSHLNAARRKRRLVRQKVIRLMRKDLGLRTTKDLIKLNWNDFRPDYDKKGSRKMKPGPIEE